MNAARFFSLALILAATAAASAAPSPQPYSSSVQHLQQRMRVMLTDVAHKNEQTEVTFEPDKSGLRTIVRVRVHPFNTQLRGDLTKNVNEYIDIHKGDCRVNSAATQANVIPLNPIANGVSTTEVNVPLSTLLGHGNVVETRTPGGGIVNCGSF